MKIAVFYENIYDGVKATGQDMESVLARLKDAGMDMLYISADSWRRDRKDLKRQMENVGLTMEGMHAFCDFPKAPDTEAYKELIDLAVDSGANNFLIVPGFLSTGNSVRDLDSITQGVRRAVEYGQTVGMPVLMEDYDGLTAPYNCMAGLKFFLDRVPGLGCAFDTGNFIMFHEDVLSAFELFADKIQTLHLKDRTPNRRHENDTPLTCADGTQTFACAPGSGDVPINEILKRLKARHYPGNVIAELYCCDPKEVLGDIEWSVRWLKNRLG
ncbi:MAG: TIM barrel protein [Clostridia bacterium]|nr:TIM barrel protein [Clostridia bacterium]